MLDTAVPHDPPEAQCDVVMKGGRGQLRPEGASSAGTLGKLSKPGKPGKPSPGKPGPGKTPRH